jgi:hypothetical protein
MELEEVIQEARAQATRTAMELDRLRMRLTEVEATHKRAVEDLKTLEDIASRYGGGEAVVPVPAPPPSPWATLNRQEAILRAMREIRRPARLPEIAQHLAVNGRGNDTIQLVSAAMGALKGKNLVESHRRGVWQLTGTHNLPQDLTPVFGVEANAAPEEETG